MTETLEHWSFELMPQDVIGNVFEHLIPQDARHSLGQYFTPDNLVDLIISFCILDDKDFVMDPTCGTGTFLIRSYQKLQSHKRKKHHEVLSQIWGFDIAGFPAELATINLCRQDFSDYLNFPRVLTKDFFDVFPGEEFEFPPPKVTANSGERIKIKIPVFDALVGNFPFIRQELIEKAEPGYKAKIGKVLIDHWGGKYQELTNNDGSLRLSGQADIYAYLYFHAAAHLKNGGRMGFITSNSWLDVAYGYELQRFFLSKFKIIAICESRCEPWFEQSAVNTVFTILERCDNQQEISEHTVRFIKIKKPLAELFPGDPLKDTQKRWLRFSQFVEKIEGIGATGRPIPGGVCHTFEKIESEYVNVPEMLSFEDDEIRMRIIKQQDLANEFANSDQTVKWGPYLRAPDIYFRILEKHANKFTPLENVADVRFGIKTGINEFFYLDEEQIKHRGIEEEFLRPVIKSPKESEKIILNENDLKQKVFLCHKDKSELKGTNALRYIKWGEEQTTDDGQKWSQVPSVQGRKNWYDLSDRQPGQFLVPMITGSSLRCIINKANVEVDHNLFEILSKDRNLLEALGIYLNSCICFIQRELIGRANLGDGALKIEGIDWKRILVPNKELLKKIHKDCKDAFNKISKRKIYSIEEEAKRKDRMEFEQLLLKAIGLNTTDAKDILEGVVELVGDRHLIPKLRKTKKKVRVERDVDKLCTEVAEEIFSGGMSRFPDAFVKNWGCIEFEEIAIPSKIIKLGESFFGKQEICDNDGTPLFEVSTIEKGKYLIYAKKKDEHIVKVPLKQKEIVKAIQDYEDYLVNLKSKFIHAFIDQCGDRILAENLTRKVYEEYNLPCI
ncbi:MAG: SAM-dependent methyltransferase [Desulfobacterales bacterium]|nr:SAM-dependent methyltransferase [Desulfobacterales bacterium]